MAVLEKTKPSQVALGRRILLGVAITSLLQFSGCDLTGGPVEVERQTETQLLKYFPYGHATASAEKRSIVAITCTHGLGKAAIEEIAEYLENQRGIQRLAEARHSLVKLSPYRYFILEFEEYRILLDSDTQQHWIVPSDTQSRGHYEQVCGREADSSNYKSSTH